MKRAILAVSSAALLALVFAFVSGAGPLGGGHPDEDRDGVPDDGWDNCLGVFNPWQRDDDEDGYGNLCDRDVDQNCGVGLTDLTGTFARFGVTAPWAPKSDGAFDVDENGGVGLTDLTNVFSVFGLPPGPTSRGCADCTVPPTLGLGLGVCP